MSPEFTELAPSCASNPRVTRFTHSGALGALCDRPISQSKNTKLYNIDRWFTANKVLLNAKKTFSMLIRNPHSFQGHSELLVMLNDSEITQVRDFKYLGVIIDGCLYF